MSAPDFSLEREHQGLVCGVDEAGRGPWAGPVCAAAVILDPARIPAGLNDSKALSEKARLRLDAEIRASALAHAVAFASVEEIDRLNILRATALAMARAVEALSPAPDLALIDGNQAFALCCPSRAVVRGDARSLSIAAASILAKTARDALMCELAARHPGYGFERHKGYHSALHVEALHRLGPCPEHRRSFAPIRALLERA